MARQQSTPIISLFCGAGGLDLGFEKAGFSPAVAYDLMPAAVATFNANRKTRMPARIADLSSLTANTIASDVKEIVPVGVIGGPPCQAFSMSNTNYKKDDHRKIFPARYAALLRALNEKYQLRFFVFENVQGITYKRHAGDLATFRKLFEKAGFRLYQTLLNAKNFGVPQDRPRVFIVGISKEVFGKLPYEFPSPLVGEPLTVQDAFLSAFGKQPWPDPAYFNRKLTRDKIPFHPNHWTMVPRSPRFESGVDTEGQMIRRSFRVLSWDSPSWTVAYGNREVHVHPAGHRRLSIYEAMALQGFPSKYELYGTLSEQVTLVSNAVPPPVAYHIAKSLRGFIVDHNGETPRKNGNGHAPTR